MDVSRLFDLTRSFISVQVSELSSLYRYVFDRCVTQTRMLHCVLCDLGGLRNSVHISGEVRLF